MGIGGVLNSCVVFNYCMEFMPRKYKPYTASLYLAFLYVPRVFIPLYLWIEPKKDPALMETMGLGLVILGSIFLVFLPESPQYYFSRGRYDRC